jgi:hypothetical protein
LIVGMPAHSNILSHGGGRYPWRDWVLRLRRENEERDHIPIIWVHLSTSHVCGVIHCSALYGGFT